MAFIYRNGYHNNKSDKLDSVSSDIIFNNQEKSYYSVSIDGETAGYRSENWVKSGHIIMCLEEIVLKLNQAGLSREVFFQSAASIDSTTNLLKNMRFTIGSGAHSSSFEAELTGDSLKIGVKNAVNSATRKGAFVVDKNIIYPSVLPYYFHRSVKDEMNFSVFDPCFFNHYIVQASKKGHETIRIDDKEIDSVRYDYVFLGRKGIMWLDSNGKLLKSEDYYFFGGRLGKMTIEKSSRQKIFMLPLEVETGEKEIKSTKIIPDGKIKNARNVSFMEVELDGIRAANIDVLSSNKRLVSANPVVLQIFKRPIPYNERMAFEIKNAGLDTMNIGTSDYIQPKDARINRLVQSIIKSETDTLKMAYAINRWVYENMKKESDVHITRSVDILSDLKGGCDEYTKLYTALARSAGIRTEIKLGLIYENDCFIYHSWPGVFSEGNWHDLDPFYGQDEADASHLCLIRGDFDSSVELLRILFDISIKVSSYR